MLIHVDQATLFPFWLCLCPWLREAGEEARVSTEKTILEELEKQPIMKHGEHERGAKDGDYYDLYDDESEEHDTDGGDGDDNDDIQAGGLKKRQSREGEDDTTSKAGRDTRISTCHTWYDT